ncbi:hypothetical protein LINPERPRIM_LOCUS10839, partial [Linum perenne]
MLRLGEVSSEGSLLISTSGSASGSSSLGEALNTCREVISHWILGTHEAIGEASGRGTGVPEVAWVGQGTSGGAAASGSDASGSDASGSGNLAAAGNGELAEAGSVRS